MPTKRKRVSAEKVRQNAKEGGRGPSWFDLPEGVTTYSPEKSGKVRLDVLPYEVSVENHPDNVEKGTIWYKREFVVHYGVGAQNQAVICPLSFGRKCPIHEDASKLERKWGREPTDEQQEALRNLRGKKMIAMNIKDMEDKTKVQLFVISSGKFWSYKGGGLQKELDDGSEEIMTFFDVKGGKTLVVRFSDESFNGHKFLQASRFDFEDRKDMDEDKTLAKTVDIDKSLNVLPYDKIKEMYLMTEDEDEEDEDADDDEGEKPRKKAAKKEKEEEEKPAKKAKKDEEEEDEEEEEEEDEEEEEEEDEEEEEEEEEGEEKPTKKPVKKTSKKDEDEDED